MLHRGQLFLKKLMEARGKVAKLASSFIVDGSVSFNRRSDYCSVGYSGMKLINKS
jgi:hypothetical protein